eukprot:gene14476-17574_t
MGTWCASDQKGNTTSAALCFAPLHLSEFPRSKTAHAVDSIGARSRRAVYKRPQVKGQEWLMGQASSQAAGAEQSNAKPIGMLVAAVGVVYGDIGTSPLYTLKEVFAG